MCGFVGEFRPPAGPSRVYSAAELIEHRGPDGHGEWQSPSGRACLAHRRLTIIDLSEAGRQPMLNEDETVAVAYNGEIYNYRELTRVLQAAGHRFRSQTDSEVLVHGYEEWGIDGLLRRIRGMFAFALWDVTTNRGYLVRDHLGVKPLYYSQEGERIVFASEAKALLPCLSESPSVDPVAVASILSFLWLPDPHTIWRGVSRLEPGHYLEFDAGETRKTRYWDPLANRREVTPGKEVEVLQGLLAETVQEQMVSDVPIGAFLSGGLDSSLIVALMARATRDPVSTYCIAFSGADKKFERTEPDEHYARHIAERFGCRHEEIVLDPKIADYLQMMLWHLDEPTPDPAAINTYLIADRARNDGIKVMLSGMGGDEVFGGYSRHLVVAWTSRLGRLRPFVRRAADRLLARVPVADERRGFRLGRYAKKIKGAIGNSDLDSVLGITGYYEPEEFESLMRGEVRYDETYNVRRYREVWEEGAGLDLVTRMCHADVMLFLPGINLAYSDKATMAASVEGRPPLVDHRLVEFALSIPGSRKIRGGTTKAILKDAARDWLPSRVIHRKKAGFVAPIRSWLRGGLRSLAEEALADSSLSAVPGVDPRAVRRLVRENDDGLSDHSHKLWALLSYVVWQEQVLPELRAPTRYSHARPDARTARAR